MECAQSRSGRKIGGAPRMRAQPLGPERRRGTYVARTAPGDALHAFGRARHLGCAESPWGRKIGGVPRMRAGRLRPQYRRGPWNAGREAEAAQGEGSLERGQGR